MARNQVRPNVGQQLKVIQPSIHDSLLLQQQELNTQLPLSINKSQNRRSKPTPKPKAKTNSLEAPYKKDTAQPAVKPTAKPAVTPKSRTVTFGDTTLVLPRDQHKLAALKQEAVDYWKNLPEIT